MQHNSKVLLNNNMKWFIVCLHYFVANTLSGVRSHNLFNCQLLVVLKCCLSVWFHQRDFSKDHMPICFILCATLLLSSSLCVVWERGVCPVASKSTVYLLCITLLLLPAHVCLGFLDWSPGWTDHTCGIRELSTRNSSSTIKKREKVKVKESEDYSEHWKMQKCTLKLICGGTK